MQIRGLFAVLTTFAMIMVDVACGGSDALNSEPAEEPMVQEPAPESAEEVLLGSGTATEIHPGAGGSPHVEVAWMVDGASISVTYGRPYLKDRVVGDSVEPMSDHVWRLGADEATTLVTDKDLMVGGTHIPAGEYTLWTQHMNDEFHLIVNTETGQWGTSYNSEHDFAHIPMEVTDLNPPVEQLVISITDGQFGFEWGQMAASASLMVH